MNRDTLALRRGKTLAKAAKDAGFERLFDLAKAATTDKPEEMISLKFKLQGATSTVRPRLLKLDVIKRIAPVLNVQPSELYLELTPEEQQEASGVESTSSAPTPTRKKKNANRGSGQQQMMKEHRELKKERSTLLRQKTKDAGLNLDRLHDRLTQAGKTKWTLQMTREYLDGRKFPNEEFLSDVAPILNVPLQDLKIRPTNYENWGRRGFKTMAGEPQIPSSSPAAPPAATDTPQIPTTAAVTQVAPQNGQMIDITLPGLSIATKAPYEVVKDGDKWQLRLQLDARLDVSPEKLIELLMAKK